MPDAVAWWGAVTGSVATALVVHQEMRARRIRVRVDHGWRYLLTNDDPPQMEDMLVYIMVTNTGGRSVPLQHVGWEWLVDSGERTTEGGRIWHAHRAEVPLEKPVLLEPDGIPHKEQVLIGQLLHLVDPFDTEVWPAAFTGGGNDEWRGPVGPLAQNVPAGWREPDLRARFDELKHAARPPTTSREGLYSLDPVWLGAEGTRHGRSTKQKQSEEEG
jgi:hypothetical protein